MNKWQEFLSDDYQLMDLGRPAIFLIPTNKLNLRIGDQSVKENLHQFLIHNFGAYTASEIPNFGFWKDIQMATISDQCSGYEVSFVGKDKIPTLLKKLAEIASIIEEECIYFGAGQYRCLIYPRNTA